MVESKRPVDVFVDVLIHVVIVIACFLCLIPLLNTLALSFSSSVMASSGTVSFWPKQFTLAAYEAIVGEKQFFGAFWISIKRVVLGGAINFLMMVLCAFPLAHSEKAFRGRNVYMYILIFTMLFSGGLVPTYIMNVRYLHINDSIWIFLLPSLVSVYNVIILRTFILTTIPDTLFEAARIDGAGHFRVYVSIVLPLFKAGIATIALFNVVSRWNDWFTGMLYIKKASLIPLQTMLKNIQDNIDFLKQNAEVAGTPDGIAFLNSLPDQNLRMACTIIVIVPILCAYPFFQRYFVQGLTMGSVKE